MAKIYVQPGTVITLVAPYTVTAGQGALVGGVFGVAMSDVTNAVNGSFAIEGVWDLAKTSAQAWTQGQKIYWDNTNKRCDNDSTLGRFIGIATDVAANPSSTGRVRLNGIGGDGIFKSTEQTGTGVAQNVAHGLGVVPRVVIVYPTDTSPVTVGAYTMTEGTHDATNVVVTVTTSKKFKVVAFA